MKKALNIYIEEKLIEELKKNKNIKNSISKYITELIIKDKHKIDNKNKFEEKINKIKQIVNN